MTCLPTWFARISGAAAAMMVAGSAQALTFISPMGEPFRTAPGGKPPEEIWFARADANGDGKIALAEFMADAGRFFRMLDTDHDDQIGPDEIEHYEDDIAPEVRTGGFDLPVPGGGGGKRRHERGGGRRHGGGDSGTGDRSEGSESSSDNMPPPEHYDASNEGGARYSYLDLPEPVAAADTNFDRAVSPGEFVDAARRRFDALDANHDGMLTRDELPRLGGGRGGHARQGAHGRHFHHDGEAGDHRQP